MSRRGSLVVDYYNQVAESYAGRYSDRGTMGYSFRVRKRLALDLLAGAGTNLLDAGCGPGVLLPDLLASGFKCCGVDLAPGMIRTARVEQGGDKGVRLAVASADQLPFRDCSFDAVVCLGVFEYLDHDRAIAEFVRVVRPNGVLVIALANMQSLYHRWRTSIFYPIVRALRPLIQAVRGQTGRPMVASAQRLLGRDAFFAKFKQAGCSIEDERRYYFQLLPSPLDAMLPGLDLRLARAAEPLADSRLKWLGQGILVKARKLSVGP